MDALVCVMEFYTLAVLFAGKLITFGSITANNV